MHFCTGGLYYSPDLEAGEDNEILVEPLSPRPDFLICGPSLQELEFLETGCPHTLEVRTPNNRRIGIEVALLDRGRAVRFDSDDHPLVLPDSLTFLSSFFLHKHAFGVLLAPADPELLADVILEEHEGVGVLDSQRVGFRPLNLGEAEISTTLLFKLDPGLGFFLRPLHLGEGEVDSEEQGHDDCDDHAGIDDIVDLGSDWTSPMHTNVTYIRLHGGIDHTINLNRHLVVCTCQKQRHRGHHVVPQIKK